MASPKVEVAMKTVCRVLGEGPHWDQASSSLLFVDIDGKEVHQWFPETGEHKVKTLNEKVSHVIPRDKGGFVIGSGRRFAEMHFDSEELGKTSSDVENGQTTFRLNDGKCDAKGRLWAGTFSMGEGPNPLANLHKNAGSLYRLDPDWTVSKVHSGVSLSNGLAWSLDNTAMFFVDSAIKTIHAIDFDLEAGTLSNQRTVVTLPGDTGLADAFPDGLTIDTEGKLWLACFMAGAVVQLDPETGKMLQKIDIPAKQTTSLCWGGPNLDELYVTTARMFPEEQLTMWPLSGSIFKVTGLGAKGCPAFTFKG